MEELFYNRYKNVMEDSNLVIIIGNLIKNIKDSVLSSFWHNLI